MVKNASTVTDASIDQHYGRVCCIFISTKVMKVAIKVADYLSQHFNMFSFDSEASRHKIGRGVKA